MLKDVVAVETRAEYKLNVRFEDGVQGVLDIRDLVSFDGVFAPLRDLAYFRLVFVDSSLGTIVWPNGADLDPDVLYARVS